MLRFLISFVSLFFFGTSVAIACSVPPAHMYLGHDEAIEDAEWIALATTVRRVQNDREIAYEMRALEYIKGEGPETFLVANGDRRAANGHSKEPAEANYYGHSVSSFWAFGGRYGNWPDCKIHPGFLFAGHKYLIFGPLDYNVGFENVADSGDVWLEYVRQRVAGSGPEKPYPIDAVSYLDEAEAIVRVELAWDGTRSRWTTNVLKGPDQPYMQMAHVSPSAIFDTMVDPDCHPLSIERERPEKLDYVYVFERLPQSEIRKSETVHCMGGDRAAVGSITGYGLFSGAGYRRFPIEDGLIKFSGEFEGRWMAPRDATTVMEDLPLNEVPARLP